MTVVFVHCTIIWAELVSGWVCSSEKRRPHIKLSIGRVSNPGRVVLQEKDRGFASDSHLKLSSIKTSTQAHLLKQQKIVGTIITLYKSSTYRTAPLLHCTMKYRVALHKNVGMILDSKIYDALHNGGWYLLHCTMSQKGCTIIATLLHTIFGHFCCTAQ